MAELVLNRFRINIKNYPDKLSFLTEDDIENNGIYYLPRYKPTKILEWQFLNNEIKNLISKFKETDIKDEKYIYVSFFETSQEEISINFHKLPYFLQKKFLKELFIKALSNKYIIEPFKEGVDFSVYRENEKESQYTRYDFVYDVHKDETESYLYRVFIGIGSTTTYILEIPEDKKEKIKQIQKLKYLKDNFLLKNNNDTNVLACPVKANFEIRQLMNIENVPLRKYYKTYYFGIKKFVDEFLQYLGEDIKLSNTFETIKKIKTVSFEKNRMIFKNNNEDYSTVNGMRDYGPYREPENIKDIQLLFIYPDSSSANKLYTYLSRGYKHFPGLESYVGVPVNIFDKKIKYDNITDCPKEINKQLTEENYSNILAICIIPFSKTTANEKESKAYYEIKKILLDKNIPSQFIYRNKIFEENFHFSLPNIAIAMMAKCGGIPWKLAKPYYNQLTVGFNLYTLKRTDKHDNKKFLGSAVFFDNEGIIRGSNAFSKENIVSVCESLITAINNYKKNSDEIINKIVIHFYKAVNQKELKKIEKTIKEYLGMEADFAIIEINDTKANVELCFDFQYESYMPQSGTYINLKKNEYLLFNNLRYWEKPINPVYQEEKPVKLRIYDPYNSFNHNELIGQVYEFSRMYWKSLKQKAQPVTTIYSKLVAKYMAVFDEAIPNNEVAKKRVWFI